MESMYEKRDNVRYRYSKRGCAREWAGDFDGLAACIVFDGDSDIFKILPMTAMNQLTKYLVNEETLQNLQSPIK
jgi:hypothetical protein